MDIINGLKRGIVFYLLALIFMWFAISFYNVMDLATGGWHEILLLTIPFFFMGLISALLED